MLSSHIRGLIQYGRIDSLDSTIRTVLKAEGPLWPEALDSIKDSLRYEGNQMPPEGKAKLQEWITLLTPTSIADRLKLYVSRAPYEDQEGPDGHYIDVAAENAKALARELSADIDSIVPHLRDLLTGEQRLSYWFGKHLVEASGKWEPLLKNHRILDVIQEPNPKHANSKQDIHLDQRSGRRRYAI
jgi:hypothetical protein